MAFARLEAITVMPDIQAMLGEQMQQALVRQARAGLKEILAIPGQPHEYRVFVDGREGVNENQAQSRIEYLFNTVIPAAVYTWELLLNNPVWAPKRPGANPPTHYRDEHLILINGVEQVSAGGDTLAMMEKSEKDIKEISFTNLQPYARKIERGLSQFAPDGVYEMTAAAVRRRFGLAGVQVDFTYRGYLNVKGAVARARGREGNKRELRYPTIILSVNRKYA